jgi:NAD+ kinase
MIERHAQIALADFTGQADLSTVEADAAIVLGGDGSILRAAHQMGGRQLPVIAVNLGRLGFLADLSPHELIDLLQSRSLDQLELVEHLMFRCDVRREGEFLGERIGLNEVAVQAGPPFAMMDVDLYVDSELVTTYSCDGLIISTPVGSTAHSLSAGGPILRKDLHAFVISPISPHTLTNRPVVDSDGRVFEMVIADARQQTPVVLDGQVLCTVAPGDRIRVRRADVAFKLVSAPGHSYYRTLREKLGWGGRLRKDREPA